MVDVRVSLFLNRATHGVLLRAKDYVDRTTILTASVEQWTGFWFGFGRRRCLRGWPRLRWWLVIPIDTDCTNRVGGSPRCAWIRNNPWSIVCPGFCCWPVVTGFWISSTPLQGDDNYVYSFDPLHSARCLSRFSSCQSNLVRYSREKLTSIPESGVSNRSLLVESCIGRPYNDAF